MVARIGNVYLVLLAEELALVAVKPQSGRHALGMRDALKACLAGLLVAELMLDGVVTPGDSDDQVVLAPGRPTPGSPALAAAAEVVAEKGPKVKPVLSHMSRGLQQRLGVDTWDAVARPLDLEAREAVVARLRAAAAGDDPIDLRTAAVLSMTGPGRLLEVVAADRAARTHARRRIDHALDGTDLEPLGKAVRRLIADQAASAAVIG